MVTFLDYVTTYMRGKFQFRLDHAVSCHFSPERRKFLVFSAFIVCIFTPFLFLYSLVTFCNNFHFSFDSLVS